MVAGAFYLPYNMVTRLPHKKFPRLRIRMDTWYLSMLRQQVRSITRQVIFL